jgi:hypothetical protein
MPTEAAIALSELSGFLEAFAMFNTKCDHGYTFSIEQLPIAQTFNRSIQLYFRDETASASLEPMSDWVQQLPDILGQWLFQFQDERMSHLVDTRRDFSLTHAFGREHAIDWIMSRLTTKIRPTKVAIADIALSGFDECAWKDIVFEVGESWYLMHLGVSD